VKYFTCSFFVDFLVLGAVASVSEDYLCRALVPIIRVPMFDDLTTGDLLQPSYLRPPALPLTPAVRPGVEEHLFPLVPVVVVRAIVEQLVDALYNYIEFIKLDEFTLLQISLLAEDERLICSLST
jgi:hypothetical protein